MTRRTDTSLSASRSARWGTVRKGPSGVRSGWMRRVRLSSVRTASAALACRAMGDSRPTGCSGHGGVGVRDDVVERPLEVDLLELLLHEAGAGVAPGRW